MGDLPTATRTGESPVECRACGAKGQHKPRLCSKPGHTWLVFIECMACGDHVDFACPVCLAAPLVVFT